MYRIHTLIDPETGEVIPFAPSLAYQVQEFQELRRAIERAEMAKQLRGVGGSHRRALTPAPANEEDQIWRLFQGGSL